MTTLVSILTPTHNHEHFISECIESVLDQTYEHWELLVVDDGSTDRTWEIVKAYSENDPRIRPQRQNNKGSRRLAETYNSALERSNGELIAILEGDDYWPSDKLRKQVSLHTEETLLSYGDTVLVDRNRNRVRSLTRPPFTGSLNSVAFLRLMLLRQSAIQPVATMCNAAALKAIGGFVQEDYPAADFPTFLQLARVPGYFVFEPTILGYWRKHEDQVTARSGVSMIEGRLALSLQQLDELPEETRRVLDVTRDDILLAHRSGLAASYFTVVRGALHDRNKDVFQSHVTNLWKYGNLKRKLQAIYAVIAFKVGLDMELLLAVAARLTNRS